MKNEVLAKILCHNLTCCIGAWYELGIDPTDWGMPARKSDEPTEPVSILRFPG